MLWFKRLMCKILRHKLSLDVKITYNPSTGQRTVPWRLRCRSCGAVDPYQFDGRIVP